MKVLFLAAAIGTAPLPPAGATAGAEHVPYRCNDLVVIARFSITGEDRAPGAAALPNWNARYHLRVRIKRLVHGSARSHTVPATVMAHDPIRSDRDFLAVLRPTGAGTFVLQKAALWDTSSPPTVVGQCR